MVRPGASGLLVAGFLLGSALPVAVTPLAAATPSPAAARGPAADPDPAFVDQAVEAFVADAAHRAAAADEDLWIVAAAAELDFAAHSSVLGRLWVGELALSSGEGALWRRAREEAAGSGEKPRAAMARLVTDLSRSDSRLLLRTAARLYTAVEPDASPSRLKVSEVEAGGLDASPPGPLSVRHRSIVPDGELDALALSWPSDGGDGAAIIRYADRALPPDVVFFAPGERRAIPLSGVTRVDFLVAGAGPATPGLRAPVDCVREAAPFVRLEAKASAGASGPRLNWTTESHSGLRGWAIFREEVLADGRIARTGPELVPSSENAEESFGYAYVDTSAAAETFYRYTVWAVTDEGLLARAFSATLETGRGRRD